MLARYVKGNVRLKLFMADNYINFKMQNNFLGYLAPSWRKIGCGVSSQNELWQSFLHEKNRFCALTDWIFKMNPIFLVKPKHFGSIRWNKG